MQSWYNILKRNDKYFMNTYFRWVFQYETLTFNDFYVVNKVTALTLGS